MATGNRSITIEIDGDASGFQRASGQATTSAGGLDRGLRNSAVGGAVAGVAMAGVTMAVGFVTDALGGASEAAREDTASQDRLALALTNTGVAQSLSTAQIEAAISANQAKGVSDDQQRQGISNFLDLTNSATDAMALNQAAIELAAARGIEYAEAEGIIASAVSGRTRALGRAGVAVAAGATATEIASAVEREYAGSLDATATTQEGRGRIASERMGEAMEQLGRIVNDVAVVVMPALADAMVWVMGNVIPPLSAAFRVLGPVVGAVFGGMGAAIRIFVGIIERVVGTVRTVAGSLGSIFRGIGSVVSTVFSGIAGVVRGAINGVISIVNSVIRAINAIQVHIRVGPVSYDFWGLRLGYIPRMHGGGVVPGAPGSDVLTILQAGERVTPAGAGGAPSVIINIENFTGSDADIDRLADRLAMRLRLQGA